MGLLNCDHDFSDQSVTTQFLTPRKNDHTWTTPGPHMDHNWTTRDHT